MQSRSLVRCLAVLGLLAGIACSTPAPARPSSTPDRDTVRAVEALRSAEDGGHEAHGAGTQALNLFVGGSREEGERNGTTFGLDYEYRVLDDVGVGGFAEAVTGLNRAFAVGGQVYWHAWKELVVVGGAGSERKDGHSGRGASWNAILRVGAFYEIPLGDDGWVLSPAVFYDFSEDEDVFLFGLNAGYVF